MRDVAPRLSGCLGAALHGRGALLGQLVSRARPQVPEEPHRQERAPDGRMVETPEVKEVGSALGREAPSREVERLRDRNPGRAPGNRPFERRPGRERPGRDVRIVARVGG